MTLKEKMAFTASEVEDALTKYLDPESRKGELFDAMRYSVFSGGKRIRPFLCLEFCEMLGGDRKAALPFACALEMLHTYSLIHDDLPAMDNDDLRRGEPTNHKVYGEATALLAGDALQTEAFYTAATNELVSAQTAARAVAELSACAGPDGMAGGQMCDLKFTSDGDVLEKLIDLDIKKTAALFRAGCVMGSFAAEGSSEDLEAAENYSLALGLAFQITDDILDEDKDEQTSILRAMSKEEAHDFAAMLCEKAKDAVRAYPKANYLRELCDMILDRTV